MFGVGGVEGSGVRGHINPPPPPPRILSKFIARYAPLALLAVLHDLPDNYMKSIPKFMGEGDLIATYHITFFDQFVDIIGIEHEDVYVRLLVHNFEGHVRTWFRGLHVNSIPSYIDLETSFLIKWGYKMDHLYYLNEFGSLRKKNSETISEYIQSLNKIYRKIPSKVKPS
jgi:hypothetical protein